MPPYGVGHNKASHCVEAPRDIRRVVNEIGHSVMNSEIGRATVDRTKLTTFTAIELPWWKNGKSAKFS